MATVNKDFKIKYGLIVEGSTATVNGYDVLTKKQDDQDYIVSLIGGTATSANEANKVVKRDANGDFAAGEITADLVGNVTGQVSDISNHSTSDLSEGTNKYYTDDRVKDVLTGATKTNIQITNVGGVLSIEAENGVADSTTDDLDEGTTNKYFTNQRALDATNAAYDAAGTAATEAGYVASDLSDHESATAAHGATGAVVGTTNTQTLINKTIGDTLNFIGAGAMTINSDSHIVLTPAAGSSVKWGSDVLATEAYVTNGVASDLTTHINDNSAHGVTGDVVGTTDSQTISNKTLGSDLAAAGYKVSGLADPTADQEAATKKYVDDEITALVEGAPGILDTLNELAAALGDDTDMATGLATAIGNKVLKAGDSMSGNLDFGGTNKVTGLATPSNTTDAANKIYVDGEITSTLGTAQGYADAAEGNANDYTDGEITTALSTAQGYATTAEGNANGYTDSAISTEVSNRNTAITTAIDALSTSDIEEGSNLYHTTSRAKDAAADLLTGASLTNITITGTGAGLTITAENGVADSDTDDLVEGTTNKYFTDDRAKDAAGYLLENSNQTNVSITYDEIGRSLTVTAENGVADSDTDDLTEGTSNLYFTNTRAQDAVDGTTRSFTSINLDTYRTEEATQQYVSAASTVTAHTFTGNKSAKYLVRTIGMDSGVRHSQISEVLVTVDGSNNVAVTEYGTIHTSTNPLSTVTADYAGGEYRLRVTTAIVNAEVIVAATTMSWAD